MASSTHYVPAHDRPAVMLSVLTRTGSTRIAPAGLQGQRRRSVRSAFRRACRVWRARDVWPVCGPSVAPRPVRSIALTQDRLPDLLLRGRAGEGNRTLMTSLEGCDYTPSDQHVRRSPS